MNRYHYTNSYHIPSLSNTLIVGSAWLALIAVAAATNLQDAASFGALATRLLIAVGSAAVAVAFLVAGLRFGRSDDGIEDQLRASLDPRPVFQEEEADQRARAA